MADDGNFYEKKRKNVQKLLEEEKKWLSLQPV